MCISTCTQYVASIVRVTAVIHYPIVQMLLVTRYVLLTAFVHSVVHVFGRVPLCVMKGKAIWCERFHTAGTVLRHLFLYVQ